MLLGLASGAWMAPNAMATSPQLVDALTCFCEPWNCLVKLHTCCTASSNTKPLVHSCSHESECCDVGCRREGQANQGEDDIDAILAELDRDSKKESDVVITQSCPPPGPRICCVWLPNGDQV